MVCAVGTSSSAWRCRPAMLPAPMNAMRRGRAPASGRPGSPPAASLILLPPPSHRACANARSEGDPLLGWSTWDGEAELQERSHNRGPLRSARCVDACGVDAMLGGAPGRARANVGVRFSRQERPQPRTGLHVATEVCSVQRHKELPGVMRILITDGNERVALATARSLVRVGHAVHVAAPTRMSLAGVSRGVRSHALATDPLTDPTGYAAEVGRLAQKESTELLLPMPVPSLEAVREHREMLRGVALPFPDLATYRAASDKAHVLTLARACGFGVPDTRLIATPGERNGAVPDAAFFPAVVKPHRSVVTVGGIRRSVKVRPVADPAACRRALAALPPSAFPVLLQRRGARGGGGVFALRWGGRAGAPFAPPPPPGEAPARGGCVYPPS